MKAPFIALLYAFLLLAPGCLGPPDDKTRLGAQPANAGQAGSSGTVVSGSAAPLSPKYANVSVRSFVNFTDPNEGAFSMEIPTGWSVSAGSGLVRPYIDAGVAFHATSSLGQGLSFEDPYGFAYVVPNTLLEYAGFGEGALYDPSGGVSKPMMVRRYATAPEFASELIAKSGLNASNVITVQRPDLLPAGNPMISQQSASESTFEYEAGGTRMRSTLLVRTMLVGVSEPDVWAATVLEYHSPAALMDETELLALDIQRSFRVNPAWAAREQAEVRKRLGILSKGQSDISSLISSSFEMRSRTMDELNEKWDKYILGIEDAYDPDTGSHYVVDSGSKYYWIDDRGNVYGTQTADSPLPNRNLKRLTCPAC